MEIRIKGKIVLLWLIVILRYRLRPSYYVFNKNATAGRDQPSKDVIQDNEAENEEKAVKPRLAFPLLSTAEITRVQTLMDNPAANIMFKTTKKGGLNVLITEVKE
jgi:hypothetical protein